MSKQQPLLKEQTISINTIRKSLLIQMKTANFESTKEFADTKPIGYLKSPYDDYHWLYLLEMPEGDLRIISSMRYEQIAKHHYPTSWREFLKDIKQGGTVNTNIQTKIITPSESEMYTIEHGYQKDEFIEMKAYYFNKQRIFEIAKRPDNTYHMVLDRNIYDDASLPKLEAFAFTYLLREYKKWYSPVPTKCQLCDIDIKNEFVDGRTIMGPWANMCSACHNAYGYGLGIGCGQHYMHFVNNIFVKIEG